MKTGKVIIFCAPSGSGKTTIVKHLLQVNSNLLFSVSACTRNKREGETHGKDYYFLSKEAVDTTSLIAIIKVFKIGSILL